MSKIGATWVKMSDQQKSKYVKSYLREKVIYDKKRIAYEKKWGKIKRKRRKKKNNTKKVKKADASV